MNRAALTELARRRPQPCDEDVECWDKAHPGFNEPAAVAGRETYWAADDSGLFSTEECYNAAHNAICDALAATA